MSVVPDGTYSIELPYGGGCITDTGEGRFLNTLPNGALGPTKTHIKFKSSQKNGQIVTTFQFADSKKYICYVDEEVHTNTKLTTGDQAVQFRITRDTYTDGQFNIVLADKPEYSVAQALERIYPPWVALINFPEKQAWSLNKIPTANL